MPRKQRFKPSRKPKTVEPPTSSQDAIVQRSPVHSEPTTDATTAPVSSYGPRPPAVIDD